MSEILFHYYRVNPTTWFYLSSILAITLFFKFGRLWSVRNLDLAGLVLLAPGLLAVEYGGFKASPEAQQLGFIWIFAVTGFFMVRMLFDSLMVRRPLLEPNLTSGGLLFMGAALLMFLMANVLNTRPQRDDVAGAATADKLQAQEADVDADQLARLGPGYPLLFLLPKISTQRIFAPDADGAEQIEKGDSARRERHEAAARIMAIISQLAIVAGTVLIGWLHFENPRLGIAAAVLYLLLPYTAIMTGRVDHALPGALITWAVAAYRRPLVSGALIGLAMGTIYYPVFLLPLWCSFYWERGIRRFALGVSATLLALVAGLWITSPDLTVFIGQLRQMFGWIFPSDVSLEGFWALPSNDSVFRLPVIAAFVAMISTMAIWPAHKNLGTLMSCSAAVLLGSQFWKAHNGGLFMAWYLPMLLLVIFRPNLEDRVALSVLDAEWFARRRREPAGERAA
jgi:MFS family permease